MPLTLTVAARERVEVWAVRTAMPKRCGPGGAQRPGPLPLHRLPPDLQRADRDATGPFTHKDRWPDKARALMAGESVAKAAARCEVAYTTAFRWRHRFLWHPRATSRHDWWGLSKPTRRSF